MLTSTFTAALAEQHRNDLLADAEAARLAAAVLTTVPPAARRRPRLRVRRLLVPRTA